MPVPNRIAVDTPTLHDRLVPREVAAEFLGLSPATLATWASAGCGPAVVKMSAGRSGAVRYRLSELEKFASDPQAYRPRPVAKFHKPQSRGGNPRVSVGRARRRRHGKAPKA
jgi:hypothetical protein